jgi:hypothetical protein
VGFIEAVIDSPDSPGSGQPVDLALSTSARVYPMSADGRRSFGDEILDPENDGNQVGMKKRSAPLLVRRAWSERFRAGYRELLVGDPAVPRRGWAKWQFDVDVSPSFLCCLAMRWFPRRADTVQLRYVVGRSRWKQPGRICADHSKLSTRKSVSGVPACDRPGESKPFDRIVGGFPMEETELRGLATVLGTAVCPPAPR